MLLLNMLPSFRTHIRTSSSGLTGGSDSRFRGNDRVLAGLFLMALLLLAGCARARVVRAREGETPRGAAGPVSIAPPLATIPVGERLDYDVLWWGVLVGRARLETNLTPDGKRVELNFLADSNWYLRALYPVHVHLNSMVDPQTVSPRRFDSYLKRQWRVHESVISFEPTQGVSVHHLPGDRVITVPVGPTTQDGLSMLYYARTMPLALGKTVPLEITADGKNWPLNATVTQAGIIHIGSAGYWPAVEGEVELAYPVPFFHGAKARVWFSADQDRIPLLAKIRSRIGPVTVVLSRRSFDSKS